MRPLTVLTVAAAMLFAASPSTPAQTPPPEEPPPIDEYVPTFTQADLFLHRNTGPIGNLDARDGKFLKWDTTSPTEAVPALYHGNNYGGILEGDHIPFHFLTMEGTAVGDLDAIAFDLYFTGWAQSTIGCGFALSFQVIIDDQTILEQDFLGSDGIKYETVDDTTVKARFALTNLWEASKQAGLEYGPDVEHDIYLNFQNFYACNEVTWQYDSTDRKSGLIVNLPTPAKKGYSPVDVLDPPPPPGLATDGWVAAA